MGRRDRLRARQLPTAEARIPADPAGFAAAERALEAAARRLQAGRLGDVDEAELVQLRVAVDAATAVLEEQPVEVFELRCLPPREWERLVDAHPPDDEQRKAGWQWNVTGFRPAVLAACVITPDGEEPLTARHWVEVAEEGELTPGELELLFATAVTVNARQPQVSLGKG